MRRWGALAGVWRRWRPARKFEGGAPGAGAGAGDGLTPEKVVAVFAGLPRVLRLVWHIEPVLTVVLARSMSSRASCPPLRRGSASC